VNTAPQFEVLNVGSNGIGGTGTGSTTVNYNVETTGLSASVSSGPQTVTVTGGLFDLAKSPPVSTFVNPSTTVANLAALIGPGTISFDVLESFTTSGTSETPDASLAFGGSAPATLSLELLYTYTPTIVAAPEPVSVALLGVGLIGLSTVRSRRRT
jgi:hypothetical protein